MRRHKLLIRTNLLIVGHNLSIQELTGTLPVFQRRRARRSLHLCWAQRWMARWDTRRGADRIESTPPAGWWRSRSGPLRHVARRSYDPDGRSSSQQTTTECFNRNLILVLILRWNISLRGSDEDTSGICTVFLDILCFSMSSPYLLRNLWMTIRER